MSGKHRLGLESQKATKWYCMSQGSKKESPLGSTSALFHFSQELQNKLDFGEFLGKCPVGNVCSSLV